MKNKFLRLPFAMKNSLEKAKDSILTGVKNILTGTKNAIMKSFKLTGNAVFGCAKGVASCAKKAAGLGRTAIALPYTIAKGLVHGFVHMAISLATIIKKAFMGLFRAIILAIGTVKSGIRKGVSLIKFLFVITLKKLKEVLLAAVDGIKNFCRKLFRVSFKIATSPFTASYFLLKKLGQSVKVASLWCVRKTAACCKKTAAFVLGVPSLIKGRLFLLKGQIAANRGQVFGVLRRPTTVLSLTFTVIAFVALRVYDTQISRIEYSKGIFEARQARKLLRQKQYVLRGYASESTSPKRKGPSKNNGTSEVSVKNPPITASSFQKTVDDFFCNHDVSEVMCDKGYCRMKIDNKIVDKHSPLAENSDIFIAESDGEHVVFADLSGNKCVKSIESLFNK